MKKFIRAVILFTLFAACLYLPLLFLWGDAVPYWVYTNLKYKRGHDSTLFMLNEARHIKNPDVLILGSSHVYRGFDVRIFNKAGYKVFNMGSSSQTPLQTYVLLQRYLKTIRPKCVVYEVTRKHLKIKVLRERLTLCLTIVMIRLAMIWL